MLIFQNISERLVAPSFSLLHLKITQNYNAKTVAKPLQSALFDVRSNQIMDSNVRTPDFVSRLIWSNSEFQVLVVTYRYNAVYIDTAGRTTNVLKVIDPVSYL